MQSCSALSATNKRDRLTNFVLFPPHLFFLLLQSHLPVSNPSVVFFFIIFLLFLFLASGLHSSIKTRLKTMKSGCWFDVNTDSAVMVLCTENLPNMMWCFCVHKYLGGMMSY